MQGLSWCDVICDAEDRAYARAQLRKRRMAQTGMGIRQFNCETCGRHNVTTDKRKKYCDEYCRNKSDHRNAAERMRNFRKRKNEKISGL